MTESEEIKRGKTSNLRKITYAMPRLGSSLVLGIEGFAFFNLYYSGYGVPAIFVTLAQAIGFIVVGLSQFFIPWLSDAKYTRLGRRKPYIIAITPLLGISFIFLFLPSYMVPNLDDKIAIFTWFLIWDIIFKISYSVTTIYQAWLAEQFEITERPVVSQFQNIFNWIGNGVMVIATFLIIPKFVDQLKVDIYSAPSIDYLLTIIIFGALAIVLFFLVAFLIPREPHYKIETKPWDNFKSVLKNRNYLHVVLMIGISSLAWSIITDVMLTFSTDVLDLGGIDFYIIAASLIIGILTFLYIWRKLISKKGKKQTLLYVFLFGAIFLLFTFIGLIQIGSALVFGIIFTIGIAGILGGWFLFPYIIYADLAEDDEKSTGELKAGTYAGYPAIILNIFQAFGVFVLGVAIDTLPNITVGSLTYSLGLIVWGPICSLILLISYYFTKDRVKLDFEWENK
ncbi:MAG: MFS transporter [Promethearchaeota archaeon]